MLRLDRAESAHLFALASRQPPPPAAGEELSDGLVGLVRSVDPVAAYIRNRRLDILAWNPAVTDLFVDFGALQPDERNTFRLTFLCPPYRSLIRDPTRGLVDLTYVVLTPERRPDLSFVTYVPRPGGGD